MSQTLSPEAVRLEIAPYKESMLSLLEMFVNHDSPSQRADLTTVLAHVVADEARSVGLAVERVPILEYGDCLVCRGPSKVGEPRVLIVAHLDTVYPEGTASERPFRIDGQRAFGPGVYDMKSGIVIALFAIRTLYKLLPDVGVAVTLLINTDEEPGSPQSRDLILREAQRHDLALIMEPGGPRGTLTLRRKGVGLFTLTVEGREAHAGADPSRGINSIVDMAQRLIALTATERLDESTTVNVGLVNGGTSPAVSPRWCEAVIDIRVASLEAQKEALARLEEIVALPGRNGARAFVRGGFHRQPMLPSQEAMRLAAAITALAGELGFELGIGESGGASDGNLTAAAGLSTIDGLGAHGGGAHSPDEFIAITSLYNKCALLALFLASLGGNTSNP
jgi:glutamate carboxypeptidase